MRIRALSAGTGGTESLAELDSTLSDRRIGLIFLLIVCVLALALGLVLAWHSHVFSEATPV
jgi:hypothetical protein